MNRDNYISIDSALNQLLSQPVSAPGLSYNDFLEKLAAHDQQNIPFDIALKNKLSSTATVPESMRKSIVLLIWYRRLKTAALLSLVLFALSLGIIALKDLIYPNNPTDSVRTFSISNEKSDPSHKLKSEITKKSEHANFKAENSIEAEKIIDLALKPTTHPLSNNSIKDIKKGNISIQFSNSIALLKSFSNLKSKTILSRFADPSIRNEPGFLPTESSPEEILNKSQTSNRFNLKSNYVVGFNLSTSFQNYRSHINNAGNQNINRNYEKLAQNGRYPGQVVNFGFTFEKPVYKTLGISIGLQKITLEQKQKTNFILSEAPVYDLDGQIAGYIDISPERIQETIENKLHYVAIPLQLIYNVNLSRSYTVQVKSGSSLLGLMDQQIQKFDYTTLELDRYTNERTKISLNNLQFGLHCTRRLQDNFMISFGYDYQLLSDIHPISDKTEKVNANLHSLNLSIKYQR